MPLRTSGKTIHQFRELMLGHSLQVLQNELAEYLFKVRNRRTRLGGQTEKTVQSLHSGAVLVQPDNHRGSVPGWIGSGRCIGPAESATKRVEAVLGYGKPVIDQWSVGQG